MSKATEPEFQQRMGRIEALIAEVDSFADTRARDVAHALVQSLLELHGAGIERILEVTHQTGATGAVIMDHLTRDDLVSCLLLLHGLHPHTLDVRVEQALARVRPFLASHGGNVQLLGVSEDGAVRLRLEGSCHGCPSSQVTMKHSIEEAILVAAPDVTAIHVEGLSEPPMLAQVGFVPLSSLLNGKTAAHDCNT